MNIYASPVIIILFVVCNIVLSEEDAVELLSHQRADIVRTLQDLQPWMNILHTWSSTLSIQQQHVKIKDVIMFHHSQYCVKVLAPQFGFHTNLIDLR